MEKRERGGNIILSIILRLFGKISTGVKGKGIEILGVENHDLKMGMGKNIKL